jgi:hypothetical protein
MSMRGYVAAPPGGADPPAVVFRLVQRRTAGTTVVRAEPKDQVDELLGATISQGMRTRATSVVLGDGVFALKSWDQGRIDEQGGVVDGRLVEGSGEGLAEQLRDGGDPLVLLRARGLDPTASADDAVAVEVGFLQRGRPASRDVVVDPLLTCPICEGPMAERKGRFGAFWGCLRYPECKGRLTVKEADAHRAKLGDQGPS